jgi:hypothetical protein
MRGFGLLQGRAPFQTPCIANHSSTLAQSDKMAVPQITLYVDIVSPFAYIAFHVLKVSLLPNPTSPRVDQL